MRRRFLVTASAAIAALAMTTAVPAATPGTASCAAAAPGGEWRSYGGGLANTRAQTAPTTINAGTVSNVAKAWVFDTSDMNQSGVLNGGTFQNTPVVADGCVFLSSSTGFVYALNADNGQRVWTSDKMPGSAAGDLASAGFASAGFGGG